MNTSRIELAIGGMTCSACARHVTHALDGVANVDKVEVDLAAKRATVIALGGVHVTTLIAAVEDAGYTAQPIGDGSAKESSHE
jgi:copper chaperone CopZ